MQPGLIGVINCGHIRSGGIRLTGPFNIRRIRNYAFNEALVLIQAQVTTVNAALLLLTLGIKGAVGDYLIVTAYLIWGGSLFLPATQKSVIRHFRMVLPLIDLTVTGYLISRTGGMESPLCSFLFIPVLVAIVRSRYIGIVAWATGVALLFVAASLAGGKVAPEQLLIKVGYLYLFGICGGFLIDRTYRVTEEVSHRLARRNDDLKRLTGDLNRVSGSSDLEQIFEQTLQIIGQYHFVPKLAVLVFDDRGELRTVKTEGWTEAEVNCYNQYPLTKYSILLATLLASGKPLICPVIIKHPELARSFAGSAIKSLWLFPLVVQGEIAGGVALADATFREISEEDRDILSSIVNQAGNAIQNVIWLNDEKKRADTDGLTALYNRRYFNERLEELLQSQQRQGLLLSLIMIDIDNFKKYNDSFGHPAGDLLLKQVARAVRETVRAQDISARYGGEEFAVILPNCDRPSALAIAERIRRTIERIRELKRPITVSIGVGTAPDQADNPVALIEFADRSLYYAKTTGKNRVCSVPREKST
jgi:diguanylate cyclase (GGDEF)-like protein